MAAPAAAPPPAKPRVLLVPPYVASRHGQDAIDLAAAAGIPLDPWQADIVRDMLGTDAAGRWAAFEVAVWISRQNGKGAIIEARELAGLFLLSEKLILHSAHEYKTAMEAFRRIVACLGKLGRKISETLYEVDGPPDDQGNPTVIRVKVNNTNGEEGLERLDTGQRLRFIARSKGSGRGFSGDLIILDEAFALTPEMIEALMPTMSARENPQILYASSPPLSYESGTVMFGLRERGEPEPDPDTPDAPLPAPGAELLYVDFGLAGDLDHLAHADGCPVDCTRPEVDLDDETNWRAANPAYGYRISTRFTQRERRAMTDVGFARERLGIWPAKIAKKDPPPIEPRIWVAMCDPTSRRKPGSAVALGLDVTPMRDRAAILLYGVRDDGLGHLQVISYAAGVDWVVARLVELKAQLDPVAIGLDAAGAAGALLDRLKEVGIITAAERERQRLADGFAHRAEVPHTRGDIYVPTAREVGQWCGQLVDDARALRLRHRNDPPLNDAVNGAKFRPLGDAVAWGRKLATSDISPLVAGTNARGAYYAVIDQLATDYDPEVYLV
ncbi:hypothetical protein Alo02nite_80660 [Actinoplanes lobatus]|uniref:Terminase n=1 Tax=Actinoplanes lobatus TaxID=113568 RepID=A0A7W7HC18_9ACTN|nr:hypothetical protein [Actinoplanes lobatus]GIE45168.1 hypothetical protein Alo02nite_80660 [Actinoplanes lobatus]